MSKESEIMREHIRTHRTVLSMCNEPEDVILNRLLDDFDSKDQRIAELEEQLKNKQAQIEHDNQIKMQVCKDIKQEVKKLIESKDFGLCNHEYANGYCYGLQYDLAKILDQIQGETK